jgi:hypothetical protein
MNRASRQEPLLEGQFNFTGGEGRVKPGRQPQMPAPLEFNEWGGAADDFGTALFGIPRLSRRLKVKRQIAVIHLKAKGGHGGRVHPAPIGSPDRIWVPTAG